MVISNNGPFVCTSAQMTCTGGMMPSIFNAGPIRKELIEGKMKGNIMDFKPNVNIPPFGMCTLPSNPAVALATAAAWGVLTPAPCMPVPAGPWTPGHPTVLVEGQPALTQTCTLKCAWAGVITIVTNGQTK